VLVVNYWIWALAAGLWILVIFEALHSKAPLLLLDQTKEP